MVGSMTTAVVLPVAAGGGPGLMLVSTGRLHMALLGMFCLAAPLVSAGVAGMCRPVLGLKINQPTHP